VPERGARGRKPDSALRGAPTRGRKPDSPLRGAPTRDATLRAGYARARERDAAARAELEPLAPGERPTSVTVAAIAALVLAVANLVATAVSHPTAAEWRVGAAQAVVLLVAAIGMWKARYWAVLGFELLLALAIVIAFLSLLRAANVAAVLYCVAIIGLCTPLFWKLVRAMARLQMPRTTTR
jgi:hypothetical protein